MSSAPITRPQVIATLRAALHAHDAVEAAWEGGSAAFGSVDDWSDVDAVAVIADNAIDAVFAHVEAALNALSQVTLCHAPTPTLGFYRLRDAAQFLVVDLVLLRRSDPLLLARSNCTETG